MIIFRILDFTLRVVGTLFFVFFLQIQFDGKTLESYLSAFGKEFIVTKSLKTVSEDGVKALRSFSLLSDETKKPPRKVSSIPFDKYIKELAQKFNLPKDSGKKKEE